VKSDLLQGFYVLDLFVDPLKGSVSGPTGAEHLPPKAMEVLLCLASAPGVLVTREALLEEVWGAGHGSQEALSHAVSEIRHALGDHPDEPKYLQTLPKRGYRLIAKVSKHRAQTGTVILGVPVGDIGLFENLKRRGVLETVLAYLVLGWLLIQIADIVFNQLLLPLWAGTFVTVLVIAGFPIAVALSWFLDFRDGRAVLDELSARDLQRRRFGRTYISVIGALAIAAMFVFAYDRSIGLPKAEVVTAKTASVDDNLPPVLENSIAVLPFLNVDGSEETQIFSNGLADDVITRLSRVPGLLVSSRGDSFTLEPNSSSQQVRERLRVAKYLEGSVEISNGQMRVIMQLIDSETGFHVQSRSFDRPPEDYFDVRDEITRLIVANVRVMLPPETQTSSIFLAEDDPSLDAYVLYRRGVEQIHRPKSAASVEIALDWYNAALEIDPDYAAAHAGICAAYVYAYVQADDAGLIDNAKSSCARALELNPNMDVVHAALGDLYFQIGQYTAAETTYLVALDIHAANVKALLGIGNTYMRQKRPDEAEARFRQATGLHPGDWNAYNSLGRFLYRSGRYAEAAEEYARVVALDRNNVTGFSNLGTAKMMVGDFGAAALAMESAIQIEPLPLTYSNLGLIHYYLGNLDDAVASHRNAIELAPGDHLMRSNLGDALWIAGKTDEAREVFETAEELATSALQVNPNDPYIHIDLAWISAMLDKFSKAQELSDLAIAAEPDDPYIHYIDGLVRLRNGHTDAALTALELAAKNGYSLQMMGAEPHLASLRGNRRFKAILETT
jgi:TolB-like protein/tetratricopeptide (TPR) repeat protein/DNA-binding winged helix-turn-helix (wHTH) protein